MANLSAEQRELPASLIWLLKGDAIQRAITSWHFGWAPALSAAGTDWQAPFLIQLLNDPYDQVRFIAHRALRSIPGFTPEIFNYDFLEDETERNGHRLSGHAKWTTENPPGSDPAQRIIELIGNEPLQAFLDRMSAARDDTPVEIPE